MKLLADVRSISLSLILLVILAGLQACGGGGGDETAPASPPPPPPPPVLQVTVTSAGIKTIQFDWSAITGASHYKLFVNPDGVSGFTELQGNILGTSTTIELPVHLTDWINAGYMLEAHDSAGELAASSSISITASMISSIGYVKASNTDVFDDFGFVVSLSADGNTLVVGASDEASSASGISTDGSGEADNLAAKSGAAYVFSRSGSIWSQQAYVKASNAELDDLFGISVSLSGDGNTLAVGARNEDSSATGISTDGSGEADNSVIESGAVYVFSRNGITWSQQAYVKASNTGGGDLFGLVLSLSADGNTLAVGADGEASNATGIDGDQANNSAAESGAVYVFSRNGTTWSQQAYVKASNTDASDPSNNDLFGRTVSLSADGNTLAVGASAEDSSATGIGGDQANNTAVNSGAVYVFSRDASSIWSQQAYVKASNAEAIDEFGTIVSLSGDGNTLAVGARNEDSSATGIGGDQGNDSLTTQSGAVYVFSRNVNSIWSQQAYVKASNTEAGDLFGVAVSLSDDGNTLAVGARLEDSNATGIGGDQTDNSEGFSGAVYVFSRDVNSIWTQQAYVKASNTEEIDTFGRFVSLSGDGNTLAVGANGEDSNATGIGGDQTDNLEESSGAVYLY